MSNIGFNLLSADPKIQADLRFRVALHPMGVTLARTQGNALHAYQWLEVWVDT